MLFYHLFVRVLLFALSWGRRCVCVCVRGGGGRSACFSLNISQTPPKLTLFFRLRIFVPVTKGSLSRTFSGLDLGDVSEQESVSSVAIGSGMMVTSHSSLRLKVIASRTFWRIFAQRCYGYYSDLSDGLARPVEGDGFRKSTQRKQHKRIIPFRNRYGLQNHSSKMGEII